MRASRFVRVAACAAVLASSATALSSAPSRAASPASNAITPPSNGGSTAVTWTGSISSGAGNAANLVSLRCTSGNPTADVFNLTVNDPGGNYYATHFATLVVRVDWTPVVSYTTNDLGLTVSDTPNTPPGNTTAEYFDSHQVGSQFETVSITNPNFGVVYSIGVCADTNVAPTGQPYTGTATLTSATLGGGSGPSFTGTPIGFGAASIVSPTFLGGEPQTTIERPQANTVAGAIDPNRVFIDWPLSTRTQTGQLYRSTTAGDVFKPLIDLSCAARNRPNCQTGGGGDTVNRVNFYDGTVFFGDQEAVANEGLASSTDHGDSFPLSRQYAISNTSTGDDRQWISTVNAPGVTEATTGKELRGFYSYHIPAAGEYIQGIDVNGMPIPQPATQILSVSQSGPSRVDTTGGPGNDYVYQGFRDGTGFRVGVSPISTYVMPGSWKVGTVSTDQPTIFPWINLDSHGNCYAAWVTNGKLFYSYSLIDDPMNNPKVGGTPATKWAPQMQVNLPGLVSTVFPEIVAGDPGHVAIAYMGTADGPAGPSDASPTNANWNTYVAFLSNGLSAAPVIATGKVNHRVNHTGSICTSGTTCTGDRSLLDMIDLQYDSAGHVGVVFTDNNSTFGANTGTAPAKGSPFVHYAREVQGPSLLNSGSAISQIPPSNDVSAPTGDAHWPNTAAGANLPSLDLTGSSLHIDGANLVATMKLSDATIAGMQRDLAAYNAVTQVGGQAARLQYVLRFSTATEIQYLAFDLTGTTPRYYGGQLVGTSSSGDQVTNGASTLAATYNAKKLYTGTLANGAITITAPAADFGVSTGSPLYSVQAFSFAGPAEGSDTLIVNPMRQIDGVMPFDTALGGSPAAGGAPEAPLAAGLVLAGVVAMAVVGLRRRRHGTALEVE